MLNKKPNFSSGCPNDIISIMPRRYIMNIMVGPAGVHYQFGASFLDIDILANTPVRIFSKEGPVYATNAFPPYSCSDDFKKLLLKRMVSEAFFYDKTNKIRMVFDDEIALDLQPSEENGTNWMIYYHRDGLDDFKNYIGYVVYHNKIDIVEGSRLDL